MGLTLALVGSSWLTRCQWLAGTTKWWWNLWKNAFKLLDLRSRQGEESPWKSCCAIFELQSRVHVLRADSGALIANLCHIKAPNCGAGRYTVSGENPPGFSAPIFTNAEMIMGGGVRHTLINFSASSSGYLHLLVRLDVGIPACVWSKSVCLESKEWSVNLRVSAPYG